MGYNRKCELFSFMLKIILLQHKVGLCLHGHILIGRIYAIHGKTGYINGHNLA